MNITLDSIMSNVDEQLGMYKVAEAANADKGDKDSHEDKEDKNNSDATKNIDAAKSSLDAAAKDIEGSKKVNKAEEGEQVKEARLQGAALAKEVMSKVAALKLKKTETNKDTDMKKEAAAAGKALADALLTKLAEEESNTHAGVTADGVPNKVTVDNAQIVAEDDAKIKPMPTGDGTTNQGTVNQILDGIVQDAIAQGAVSQTGNVAAQAGTASANEGAAEAIATPNQVPVEDGASDEVEKAAAVAALVQDGFDFNSAVEMVKVAEQELNFERDTQIKQAALGALMDRGVSFEDAVDMVKSAVSVSGVADAAKAVANKAVQKFTGAASKSELQKRLVDAAAAGENMTGRSTFKTGVRQALRNPLVRNSAIAGGAALGGVGAAAAMHRGQEKAAALGALIDSGVDYDTAVDLVDVKSVEIYGY